MSIIKYCITWLYIKIVFIPGMKEEIIKEALNPNVRLVPQKIDKNWTEIEQAQYEKRFFTLQ